MKEKIEKAKTWFKKNWVYVTAGATTAGVIALAIVKGMKSDGDVIDPLVIDRGKDDWMDELKAPFVYKDRQFTVREAFAAALLDEYERRQLKQEGIFTDAHEADLVDKFVEEYPEQTAVLDQIEGFWTWIKRSEKT